MDSIWNPWHGCHKISSGCMNCYVYRTDSKYDKDSSKVCKNKTFDLPLKKKRNGEYALMPDSSGIIYTCFTSDFFLEDADEWRDECWKMIKMRSDAEFLIITKRIHRFYDCIPDDWGSGYDNVHICCTCENQDRADFRLPIFRDLPIKKKSVICEPLLEQIDLSPYLSKDITQVVAGGESGINARICRYEWILKLRQQCLENHVDFYFKQTGAKFVKDGKLYLLPRKLHHSQAKSAGINLHFSSEQ